MEIPFKVYYFNRTRNKSGIKNTSSGALKKEIIKRDGNICYLCGLEKNNTQLELEHVIPVYVGGRIFCKTNLKVACNKCHREKTEVDKKVIKMLKISKIIFSSNSLLSLEKLRELYLYLFKITKESSKKFKLYMEHGGKDGVYVHTTDYSNREVEK